MGSGGQKPRSREKMDWALALAKSEGGEPIRTESGYITNEPSDDELIPYVPREALATHSSLPPLETNWNNSGGGQQGEFRGNPTTPKRAGEAPAAPSPQGQKLSELNIREQGDTEFAEKGHVGDPGSDFTLTITELEIAHSGKYPTSGVA